MEIAQKRVALKKTKGEFTRTLASEGPKVKKLKFTISNIRSRRL